MGAKTNIEWTATINSDGSATPGASWNPVRARAWEIQNDGAGKERLGWHCEHVSEGCRNCYAESFNMRLGTGFEFKPGNLRGKPGFHNGGIEQPEIFLDEKMLLQPLHWKRPRKIFVGSMTDIFADFVSDEMLDKIFAVAALCPQHTFLFLTKRPARMRLYFSGKHSPFKCINAEPFHWLWDITRGLTPFNLFEKWPLPNVWLGFSAEDQQTLNERWKDAGELAEAGWLLWCSAEPLLGRLDFTNIETIPNSFDERGRLKRCGIRVDALTGRHHESGVVAPNYRLHWVVCGGESGPHARPMHPDWARPLRDQCAEAGVAFFFKQWGEYFPRDQWEHNPELLLPDDDLCREGASGMLIFLDSAILHWVGKSRAGRLLDGIEHNAFPERCNPAEGDAMRANYRAQRIAATIRARALKRRESDD